MLSITAWLKSESGTIFRAQHRLATRCAKDYENAKGPSEEQKALKLYTKASKKRDAEYEKFAGLRDDIQL